MEKNIECRYDQHENEYGWEWEHHITFPDGKSICFRGGDWLGAQLNAAQKTAEMVSAKEIETELKKYASICPSHEWVLKYLED